MIKFKQIPVLFFLTISLVGCSILKNGPAKKNPAPVSEVNVKNSSPIFIENISIRSSQATPNNLKQPGSAPLARNIATETGDGAEKLYNLQFKYAILLDAPVEEMQDHRLISFLENWYGTRYRMGGADKSGIDCSAFVQTFMMFMYNVSMARTSREQYLQCDRILKSDLQEGDLVFFRTQRKKGITHVGVYLRNNKFVHASTSSGVMISDMNEAYFAQRFASAGRISEKFGQGTSN